jgi:hypothetical protein
VGGEGEAFSMARPESRVYEQECGELLHFRAMMRVCRTATANTETVMIQ